MDSENAHAVCRPGPGDGKNRNRSLPSNISKTTESSTRMSGIAGIPILYRNYFSLCLDTRGTCSGVSATELASLLKN